MKAIKIAIKIIVIVAVLSLVVMLLWNWLVPQLFGGPFITYLQSFGLLVLTKILLGGFGRHFEDIHRSRNRYFWKRFEEKLEHMTPEEKEKYKSNMCF